MSNQEPSFNYTYLESKLRERLANALSYISALSKEDVLRCDNACLTEIVRQFAVAPPILRSDLMEADESIIEAVDILSPVTDAVLLLFLSFHRLRISVPPHPYSFYAATPSYPCNEQ